jgi:hypothetical protein
MSRRLPPGLRDEPGDRSCAPSRASVGRTLGARSTVLVVPGVGTDDEAAVLFALPPARGRRLCVRDALIGGVVASRA